MPSLCFNGNETKYVTDCIRSGWVAGGEYIEKFEKMLSDYTGAYAVATVNGTSALHVALRLAGVSRGDAVVVPSLTFVATANAVSYLGAVPHFADIDKSLHIDPMKLYNYLKTNKVKAVIVVHTFGHPADMDTLTHVCLDHNVVLVEDAAQSLGSFYKDEHTGTFGRISAVSFNGNKIITTGGGGAILTKSKTSVDLARHLIGTARIRPEYYHDMVGYNYRMPNINAALGCAQMEQLEVFIERKREIAKQYHKQYGYKFLLEPPNTRSNYWWSVVVTDEEIGKRAWIPLHKLPMYKDCPKMDLSMCEELEEKIRVLS